MKPGKSRLWICGGSLAFVAVAAAAGWWTWPRTSPDAVFAFGLDAAQRGDLPNVAHSADRLGGYAGFSSHEHLLRAIHCLKTGRPVEALSELSALKPEGELREPAVMTAGEALYRTDRISDAYHMFSTLASEQPGHVEAHRWLAAIDYDLGAMTQAMDELDVVSRLHPEDYRPYQLKGLILFDQEMFADAAKAYSQALDASPPQATRKDLLVALARAQMRTRDYAAALKTLDPADQTPEVLALQADCLSSLGQTDEAWTRIREARDRDADQSTVLHVLARLELDAGHIETAIELFRQILKQDPHDHEIRHQLSVSLRQLGKTEEADAETARAAKTVELKVQLAALNLEAIKQPADVEIRERIAKLCDELNKPKLAETWRKAAAACRKFVQAPKPTFAESLSTPK